MASSSITPALKTSARSAYRALFRASGATFAGDDRVLYAFRDKVRTETIAGRQEPDPVEYEARVKHAFEVADVLKKNIVQGVKQGEGEEAAWKLRITSDTELGSNEGVKTPYSRPTRGTPRPKCGEDPNAVSPLPPRSLRHMANSGSGSTRSYSTSASGSGSGEQEAPNDFYDPKRVESLRNKLFEVNRRVSASPTGQGKEPIVERVLVEDKLGALAARMDFLASETRDKIYLSPAIATSDTAETTTRATAQTLINLLLDTLPIHPGGVSKSTNPPVQLKQYVRYLQLAGKYTTAAQNEALGLPGAVRTAIGEVTETPAAGTRSPNGALDELRALQWRMLMIKRGMQRVVQAGSSTLTQLGAMSVSLRNAMRHLSHARECIEDLEERGPRSEDALALLEEMERTTDGSVMLELRREVERRLDAGVAWKRVGEEVRRQVDAMKIKSLAKLAEPPKEPRIRYIYDQLRMIEDEGEFPRLPPRYNPDGSPSPLHSSWRRRQLGKTSRVVNLCGKHITSLHSHLDRLETFHPEDAEKIAQLREAKRAVDLTLGVGLAAACEALRPKAKWATCHVWAHLLDDRRGEVERLKAQLRNTDAHIRAYRKAMTDEAELSKDMWKTLLGAKLELNIAYDVIWRLARRLGQDVADMQEMAAQVGDEVYEEVFTNSDKPMVKNVNRTRRQDNTAAKALHNVFDDDPN